MIMVDRRSAREAGWQAGTKFAVPVGAQITRPMTAQAAFDYAHLPLTRSITVNVFVRLWLVAASIPQGSTAVRLWDPYGVEVSLLVRSRRSCATLKAVGGARYCRPRL